MQAAVEKSKGRMVVQAAVEVGLAAAKSDGFAWLGSCNPKCFDDIISGRQVMPFTIPLPPGFRVVCVCVTS